MKRQLTSDGRTQFVVDLIEKRDFEGAFRKLEDAIMAGIGKPDDYWLRGSLFMGKGVAGTLISEKKDNFRNAVADYRRCAQLDPSMFLSVCENSLRLAQRYDESGGPVRPLHRLAGWPATTWAVPAYIQLLRHSETLVRFTAAVILRDLATDAQEAKNALENVVATEDNAEVAAAIKRALRRISASQSEIEQERSIGKIQLDVDGRLEEHKVSCEESDLHLSHADLLQRVANADVAIRASAICIIGARKEGSIEACKRIAVGLAPKEKAIIRCLSVYALGQLASAHKATVSPAMNLARELLKLLKKDKSSLVRKAAAEALGAIGIASGETVQGLIHVLENGDAEVEVRAIESLGQFGEAAKGALHHIKRFKPKGRPGYGDYNESLIVKHEALLKIASSDPGVVDEGLPVIIAGLEDVRPVRLRAIKALGTVQPDKMKRVLSLIKPMWMDDSPEIRHAAAETLLRVDHDLAVECGVLEYSKCHLNGKA